MKSAKQFIAFLVSTLMIVTASGCVSFESSPTNEAATPTSTIPIETTTETPIVPSEIPAEIPTPENPIQNATVEEVIITTNDNATPNDNTTIVETIWNETTGNSTALVIIDDPSSINATAAPSEVAKNIEIIENTTLNDTPEIIVFNASINATDELVINDINNTVISDINNTVISDINDTVISDINDTTGNTEANNT